MKTRLGHVTRIWFSVAIVAAILCAEILLAREWADRSGTRRVEAELIGVRNGKAYLEKTDAKVVAIPLNLLSVDDVRHLMSLPEYRQYFEDNPVPDIELARSGAKPTPKRYPTPVIHVDDESIVGEVRRFEDFGFGARSLAFSPDGRFLAVGKFDGSIMVFDVDKSKMVAQSSRMSELGQVTCMVFSPDGRRLLAGGSRGRIQVYDVASDGRLTEANRFAGHSQQIYTITVSKDSEFVLSGGREKLVRCWTLHNGREQFAVDGFEWTVKATHITASGKQGLACDGEILALIDMKEGKTIETMPLEERNANVILIAPDGSRIVVGDGDPLESRNIATGQGCPLLEAGETLWSGTFLPDSKRVLTGGRNNITLWDVASGKKSHKFNLSKTSHVENIVGSPDNRHFAIIPDGTGRSVQVIRMPLDAPETPKDDAAGASPKE